MNGVDIPASGHVVLSALFEGALSGVQGGRMQLDAVVASEGVPCVLQEEMPVLVAVRQMMGSPTGRRFRHAQ